MRKLPNLSIGIQSCGSGCEYRAKENPIPIGSILSINLCSTNQYLKDYVAAISVKTVHLIVARILRYYYHIDR